MFQKSALGAWCSAWLALACTPASNVPLAPISWAEKLGEPTVTRAKNPNRDVDCNGDGHADLVTIDTMDPQRALLMVPGSPAGLDFSRLQRGQTFSGGLSSLVVAHVGDVNGDGYSDFAVANEATSVLPEVHVFLCGAAGLPERRSVILTEQVPTPSTRWSELKGASARAAGDLNGDGYADLVVDRYLWTLSVHYGGPQGPSATPDLELGTDPVLGRFLASLPVGDLDQDGFADLLVVRRTASDDVRVLLHRGSATGLAPTGAAQPTPLLWDTILRRDEFKVLDFDADGFVDLVGFPHPAFPHRDRIRSTGFWWRGDSVGFFGTYRSLMTWREGAPLNGDEVAADEADSRAISWHVGADVDGDGVADVVGVASFGAREGAGDRAGRLVLGGFRGGAARRDETDTYSSWYVTADYDFPTALGAPVRAEFVCPGDVDGDGFDDCLLLSHGRVFPLRGSPTGPRPTVSTEHFAVPGLQAATRITLVDPLNR